MLGLFERVYVISLPASKERRDYVASHLAKAGLGAFEFHDAVGPDDDVVRAAFAEGRVAQFPPCFRCGKTDCGNEECNNVLIAPQVAVFCTYLELWRKVVARNECVLICEDDVVFHPWWRKVITMIEHQREAGVLSWGTEIPAMVRLGWAENDEHRDTGPYRLSRDVRMANPCHLMTPAYAAALIDEFSHFDHTADVFAHQRSEAARNWAWTAHPPAATELSWSRGAVDSLIHPKPVRSAFLRHQGEKTAADENDRRINAHIKHLYYRDFLIVGHPRCGTGFTAQFLRQLGLDVGHEADGKDGLASWMFAVEGDVPYAQSPVARRREALRWGTLVQSLRDITTAVPSIMRENTFSPPSYDFRRKQILQHFGEDLNALPDNFQRAVVSYLRWNELIEAMNPDVVFRIEFDHAGLQDFVSEIAGSDRVRPEGIDLTPVNADKKYKGVRYPKARISGEQWASLPATIWRQVEAFCEKHGYDLPRKMPPRSLVKPVFQTDLAGLDSQFLRPSGWSRSRVEERPVRADGTPVPRFTFAATEFLERIVRRTDRVFEYGAGNGTLWWQSRVASVVSVNHDLTWTEALKPRVGTNVSLSHVPQHQACDAEQMQIVEHFRTRMRRTTWPEYDEAKIVRRGLDDEGFTGYAAAIAESPAPYDVVVIGGMARRLCTEFAVRHLDKEGVIVLGNSNRRDYDAAFDILQEAGFHQIPFWGLVPGANHMTCTSVFTRTQSRLASAEQRTNTLGLPED